MKHYKKKELLKTVSTLEKANDTIIKSVRANPGGAAEALALCQESAIVMGTCIEENLDEKYAYLVRLLEDYCENIFQMSEAVPDETRCRKIAKKIQKQLSQLRHGITFDLPDDRKEVVFLPYKASMWDSLESVWKAAEADENTDAYVIPIPYFDKNPDGTFREMHYEGDQYPKDVPITHYEEYDLEACRPDVIYIHNPYDECNHVTSVHPYFYCENLRKFTDCLVYIPYFVLGEIDPDNQAAIDGMKHFCFLPGTMYADRVILQSENMRQIYINEYIKAAKAAGLSGEDVNRRFLEKKFLGIGSPKIDKVLNTKKEDLEIPSEWLKVIEKPDGSWKKIVFYNTSVSALLHNDEKMLRKMESVFEIFKENGDEVALLWRPHPLIQATIESMRPQLWEGYRKIRERYIEEGWGICDDTADLDRAIVVADAYYGDGSSVVELCKKAEMPVMLQNTDIFLECENILLSTYGLAFIGDEVYFSSKNITGFFKYNRYTNKITQIAFEAFSLETVSSRFAFGGVCIFRGNIFFAPFSFSKALLYCEEKKSSTKVINFQIRLEKKLHENWYIKRAIVFENWIYLVGNRNSEILGLNMDNMQMSIFSSWRKELPININDREYIGANTGGDVCIIGNSLWVPINCNNHILEIDMKAQTTSIHKINVRKICFSTICYDGSWFWLTGNEPFIVKWNKDANLTEVLDVFPEGFQKFEKENYWNDLFSRSFYQNGHVYLFPLTVNMVLKINIETNHIEKIYEWSILKSCYTVEVWDKDTFYIEIGNNNYIDIDESMLMDVNGTITKRNIFTISSEDVKYNFAPKGSGCYTETQAFTLNRLLKQI